MDVNYTITEFYIEVNNLQVCGLPGQRHIELPITAPREVAAVKTATKILKWKPSVSERPKSVEFMVKIVSSEDP